MAKEESSIVLVQGTNQSNSDSLSNCLKCSVAR